MLLIINHADFVARRSAWVGYSRLSVCPQYKSKTNDPRVQGRNFGPKSGGANSEEERGTFGSRGSGVWESVLSSQSGVRVGASAENGFTVIQTPQMASVDSKFFTFLS